jgi:hypothetical protein
MRALCLVVVGGLGLLAASCGSGAVRTDDITPVSKYKEMIVGKWEADGKGQLVQGYEFGPDDKLKVILKGMADSIPGTYTWTGDKELELKYQAPEEVKKQYAAAIKAHKRPSKELAAKGGPFGDTVQKNLDAIPDELPAAEKVKVILGEKPHELLIVTPEGGVAQTFKRAK